MKLRTQALWSLAGVACLLLLGATAAPAQTVTTGSLTGIDFPLAPLGGVSPDSIAPLRR